MLKIYDFKAEREIIECNITLYIPKNCTPSMVNLMTAKVETDMLDDFLILNKWTKNEDDKIIGNFKYADRKELENRSCLIAFRMASAKFSIQNDKDIPDELIEHACEFAKSLGQNIKKEDIKVETEIIDLRK
jgi:hypothetical protein